MYVFIYIIRKDKNLQKKELGMKIYFFSSSPTAKTIWPVIIGCRPVTFRRFSIRPPFGFYVVSLSLSFFFIFFSLPSPRSLPLFVGTSSGSHTATTGTKTQSARASPRNVHAEFSLLFVLLFFLTSFVLDSFSSPIGSN